MPYYKNNYNRRKSLDTDYKKAYRKRNRPKENNKRKDNYNQNIYEYQKKKIKKPKKHTRKNSIEKQINIKEKNVSEHYQQERQNREHLIQKRIGDGNIIKTFVIDNGHKNGVELHHITDTGLIIIRNKHTGRLVTKLIARPTQIEKYYHNIGKDPPRWLIDLALYHTKVKHYNDK